MLKVWATIVSLFTGPVVAQETNYNFDTWDDEPAEVDYNAGHEFTFSRGAVWRLNRQKAREVDSEAIALSVSKAMEDPTGLPFARMLDDTLESTIVRGEKALRHFGYEAEADKMAVEFHMAYKNYFVRTNLNGGVPVEIGQHPPMNIWVELVHATLHIKLGDFWCQYFRVHDLFVINFAVPVVFKPKGFRLDDYLDHFAGHPLSAFKWDHHGLAGVVTYWTTNIACGAATAGIGMLTFACGPISGLAETVMDRRIAPPIGRRVWNKANSNLNIP